MAPILKKSSAYHIGIHPERFEIDLLESLKTSSEAPFLHGNTKGTETPPRLEIPWLSAETFTGADSPISRDRLQQLLSIVDIFSPNLVEAESILGIQDPEQVLSSISRTVGLVSICTCVPVLALRCIIRAVVVQMIDTLLSSGGKTIVIRMGADGSLLARQGEPIIHVPATSCDVVDVTGCGNAFNGALLRSIMRGDSLACAGAWGSAAAASMAESTGGSWALTASLVNVSVSHTRI